MFEAPIPGESLTREPKNAAFERAPELSDPEDALIFHIDRLTDEEIMTAIFTMLESGVSIRQLTEGFLRMGVYKGIHSIDVSMLIGPAVHEYIKTSADMLGIEYTEGFENKETAEKAKYSLSKVKAKKALSKIGANPAEVVEEIRDSEEFSFEEPMLAEQSAKGLMARKVSTE